MPHLHYLNRYWMISSDDFPLFLTFTVWFRSLFILAIIIIEIIWSSILFDNISFFSNVLIIYLNTTMILFSFIIITEIFLILRSFIGTLIDDQQRVLKVIEVLDVRLYLLYLQIFFIIIGIVCLIVATEYSLYGTKSGYYDLLIFSIAAMIYSLVDTICAIVGYFAFSYPQDKFHNVQYNRTEFEENVKLKCINTCYIMKFLTCGLFGGGNDIGEDIESVANILTDIFQSEGLFDIVFTDIVAGVILLANNQRFRAYSRSNDDVWRSSSTPARYDMSSNPMIEPLATMENNDLESSLSPMQQLITDQKQFDSEGWNERVDQDEELIVAERLYKYCIYSCAIYSYLLRLYAEPCKSCVSFSWNGCKAMLSYGCCCCKALLTDSTYSHAVIEGRDPLWSHRAAIGDWTKNELRNLPSNQSFHQRTSYESSTNPLTDIHLVYSNINNSMKMKPYAVFYNRFDDEVIIAIRGTLSLEDCVTDAMAEPVRFNQDGIIRNINDDGISPENYRWAHEGMTASAFAIRDELERKQILSNQVLGRVHDSTSPLRKGSNNQFRLVITGHSLGAGIGSILGYLLRPKYPQLRCYCYGVPGAVVDNQTSIEMSSFMTTVILGDDMVSRTSFDSIINLKLEILRNLSKSSANKGQVFRSVLLHSSSLRMSDYIDEQYAEHIDSDFKRNLHYHINSNQRSYQDKIRPKLYLPGRIIHVKPTEPPPLTSLCCFGRTPNCCKSNCFNSLSRFDRNPLRTLCIDQDIVYTLNTEQTIKFNEIIISSTMGWDHFPDRYLEVLKGIVMKKVSEIATLRATTEL